jgi:hypothetical protein
MEPEGSLPSSQELSTCTYPELEQSSPQHSLILAKMSKLKEERFRLQVQLVKIKKKLTANTALR